MVQEWQVFLNHFKKLLIWNVTIKKKKKPSPPFMSFTEERFSRLSCGIERLPAPTRVVRGFWMNFRQVPVHFVHVQTWKSTCQLKQVNALRGKFSLQSMEVNMVIMHSTVSISWKYGVHKCIFFISLLREGHVLNVRRCLTRSLRDRDHAHFQMSLHSSF